MDNPVPKKPEAKKKINLAYERDKDREPVRGKFIFHEIPGGNIRFAFRKYKQDPIETYNLIDGQIYTLPLGVAKHLNKNCWYPVHHYALDDAGKPVMKVGQKVRRCSFQSLEFVDIDDLTPTGGILEVESIPQGLGI